MLEAPALHGELEPAMEKLGVTEASEQVRLLAGELEQAPEDVAVTGRAVAAAPPWLLVLGIALAIAAIAAGIAASQELAGAAVALLTVLTTAGAIAVRVRSGAQLLHDVADGLRRRQDAAVAGELAQLRQAETSERVLQAQLDEAIGQVGELSRELAELTPGRRLYSFVAERAASDVYRGQLGLISTIRKDFEELSVLMQRVARPRRARTTRSGRSTASCSTSTTSTAARPSRWSRCCRRCTSCSRSTSSSSWSESTRAGCCTRCGASTEAC